MAPVIPQDIRIISRYSDGGAALYFEIAYQNLDETGVKQIITKIIQRKQAILLINQGVIKNATIVNQGDTQAIKSLGVNSRGKYPPVLQDTPIYPLSHIKQTHKIKQNNQFDKSQSVVKTVNNNYNKPSYIQVPVIINTGIEGMQLDKKMISLDAEQLEKLQSIN